MADADANATRRAREYRRRAAKLTEAAQRARDADELAASLAVVSQSTNGPVHD